MLEDSKRLNELNKLYDESKNCDNAIFSEQRTNILLKNGEHYRQKSSGLSGYRNQQRPVGDKKIRLTKNHIHKIVNIYENSILEANPSITAVPFNDADLHDVKVADMNNAVIAWVKETNSWGDMQDEFVDDFIVEGEVYAKVLFDFDKGNDVAIDDTTDEVIKSGEFTISRIMAYDIKRDADSKTIKDSRFLIEDSLMNTADLVDLALKLNPESVDQIKAHYSSTKLTVFDSNTGRYKETRGKVPVRLWYWRPNKRLPLGKFEVSTDKIVVGSTDLPLGLFPIISEGFDRLTNSPRSTSIIRVIKPFQVEYNRTNSKMAEHQITLGDDRVYIQKGTKLTGGKVKSGVRSYQVSGAPPVIQSGRSGAQYLDYSKDTKLDMYEAANIDYVSMNKQPSGDSYQMLFSSMKDKKKFVKYVNKYNRFEVKLFKLILKMSKQYLSEDHLIKIAGKKEYINIPEFKDATDEGFEIKVEASSGDIESKFGKVLSMAHVLQYAGSSLKPDQIGQIIRSMPYGNESLAFDTLTSKSKSVENLILALDRGEYIPTRKYDDHEYILEGLYNRVSASDFSILDEQVKMAYEQKIAEQEEFFATQKQQIEQANMGMIPSGGFLTTVNTSWFNPERKRVERIKIPSEAIKWLMDKLQTQGAFTEDISSQNPQVLADMSQQQGEPQANQQAIPPIESMPQA